MESLISGDVLKPISDLGIALLDQIVDKAISLLEKGDNPEKLDNDWVLRFFEFCKNVSNEDLQF